MYLGNLDEMSQNCGTDFCSVCIENFPYYPEADLQKKTNVTVSTVITMLLSL